MSDLVTTSSLILQPSSFPAPAPLPQIDVIVRPGTTADIPFVDQLQKKHSKQVGFMQRKALEGKINAGHVLIAENGSGEKLGYCIGNDQYFKRDDLGIIYQLNVVPGKQRGLIGATLLKAQFERSAYGCRLYCCWCAQDIAANRFWEAMGFVPLAFRAGSEKKSRIHIFWQKRIRSGDVMTPWWFPSKTSGGSIREDRLVFPIPPDTHWNDAKPLILPNTDGESVNEPKKLPGPTKRKTKDTPAPVRRNGLIFDIPRKGEPLPKIKQEKPARIKRKADPMHIAAARELRDRYLEQVNNGGLELPGMGGDSKYDVCRSLSGAAVRLLPAA